MRHEKPELSLKNPYYLPRHRYYELKHFCLQYATSETARAAYNVAIDRIRCRGMVRVIVSNGELFMIRKDI